MAMGRLSPASTPFLRPLVLRSHVVFPIPKARTPPRCAFASTAFKLIPTGDKCNPNVLYEPLEVVERIEHYRPGGYHPIQIGDHHGRYQVIHKLGHGSYSTTWLARGDQNNKYVAVKICTSDSDPKEISILTTLTRPHYPATSHPGKTMLPSILDAFSIHGPNGEHICYVTSPARASLSDLKDGSNPLSLVFNSMYV